MSFAGDAEGGRGRSALHLPRYVLSKGEDFGHYNNLLKHIESLYRPLLYNLPLQSEADPTTTAPLSSVTGKGDDVCVTVENERQREILSR